MSSSSPLRRNGLSLTRFIHPYYVLNILYVASYFWVRDHIDLAPVRKIDMFGFDRVCCIEPWMFLEGLEPGLPP